MQLQLRSAYNRKSTHMIYKKNLNKCKNKSGYARMKYETHYFIVLSLQKY